MIGFIQDMLDIDEMIGVSKTIDIAKGSNKLPLNIKDAWKQYKRKQIWQLQK